MTILVICPCGHRFERPEAEVGRLATCPDCGSFVVVPKLPTEEEILYIPGDFDQPATSGKAVASLVFGSLSFLICLSVAPAIVLGRLALDDIRQSNGRLKGWRMAYFGIVLSVVGCLFSISLSLTAYDSAREAARRAWCVSNLKQIGLALLNYQDHNGCLPPAAITDKAGKPLLSWRVALLTEMEIGQLHAKFHLDEPWDSPHNLTLIDQMPQLYACPSDFSRKPGMTNYQVVVGPGTTFRPDFQPIKQADITDGTTNTLLVVETRQVVPWTKPEDLPIDSPLPLSGLGSHHHKGFNVLCADGSVRFLKSTINPAVLRWMLTIDANDGHTEEAF